VEGSPEHGSEPLSTYLGCYSPCGSWLLFQFRSLYTEGTTPWTGDQPVARPLPTYRMNAHRHPVGLEPTIPVFERAKTVHALDREATVIGSSKPSGSIKYWEFFQWLSDCQLLKKDWEQWN
jgi:hypothetical protein